LSQEFTNWKAWNNVTPVAEGTPTGWAQDNSTYIPNITDAGLATTNIYGNNAVISNTALIGKTTATGGYKLEVGGDQLVNGKLVLGARPANEHLWTLALDQHNTLYSLPSAALNIMHNLYHDGNNWRYRYGSGNSGGVLTTLAYNQFSVNVAGNGVADSIATLTPAIHTNLSGNTAFGKNTFAGGYRLEVEGHAYVNGSLLSNAIIANDYLHSRGPLFIRNHIYLLNKAGDDWLNFVTRDESGSEAKFNLSNIGSIDGVGPITLSDGGGGYFQLYNNSGQGLAKLKAKNNIMCFTVEDPTLPEVNAITIHRDAGSLGDGIPLVNIDAVTNINENIYIQSDVNVSHNSLVRLSGAVRYDYIQHIGSVPTIDTDNYPGIYLIPSNPHNYTLTGGTIEQRIFVGNRSTHVQQVEGYRIEPGQFRDFLKTGTGWIASGASISGKTTNVSSGTGNISVSNVSTVHINYSPTSTYTLTNGYIGQRVTVVVLGSAQHWIQGATKAHKIVAGEFRDFIYTTDGWVASAAD
jgi:hypothetical protein